MESLGREVGCGSRAGAASADAGRRGPSRDLSSSSSGGPDPEANATLAAAIGCVLILLAVVMVEVGPIALRRLGVEA